MQRRRPPESADAQAASIRAEHPKAKRLAAQDQASLNQFITVAVAEKVSALHTAEFFAQRAGNAQAGDLAQRLLWVKNREPLAGDEMPDATGHDKVL